MKSPYMLPAFAVTALALLAAPAGASTVFGSTQRDSLVGGAVSLLNTVGFISGSQAFSQSFSIPTAGTLTVTLADVPWLDTLQNLNTFLSAPDGQIQGSRQNGGFLSESVQPGDIYVNWSGQDNGPLTTGAFSISVIYQPAALPVPLPPGLILAFSGLVFLGLRVRPRLGAVASC